MDAIEDDERRRREGVTDALEAGESHGWSDVLQFIERTHNEHNEHNLA